MWTKQYHFSLNCIWRLTQFLLVNNRILTMQQKSSALSYHQSAGIQSFKIFWQYSNTLELTFYLNCYTLSWNKNLKMKIVFWSRSMFSRAVLKITRNNMWRSRFFQSRTVSLYTFVFTVSSRTKNPTMSNAIIMK